MTRRTFSKTLAMCTLAGVALGAGLSVYVCALLELPFLSGLAMIPAFLCGGGAAGMLGGKCLEAIPNAAERRLSRVLPHCTVKVRNGEIAVRRDFLENAQYLEVRIDSEGSRIERGHHGTVMIQALCDGTIVSARPSKGRIPDRSQPYAALAPRQRGALDAIGRIARTPHLDDYFLKLADKKMDDLFNKPPDPLATTLQELLMRIGTGDNRQPEP